MKISIEIDEKMICRLIAEHVNEQLGRFAVQSTDVKLYVKSKQNYRSTWEEAGVFLTNAPTGQLEKDVLSKVVGQPEVKATVIKE